MPSSTTSADAVRVSCTGERLDVGDVRRHLLGDG